MSTRTKILIIHTQYIQLGGEDGVFRKEVELLKGSGYDVSVLIFKNKGFSFFKFITFPFNIYSYFKTRSIIKKCRPDVVHIHNFFHQASPSIFYAIRSFNIPCVMTIHNFRLLCPSATLFNKQQLYLKSIGKTFPWNAIKDRVYRNSYSATFWNAFSFWIHYKAKTWNLVDTYLLVNPYAKYLFQKHNSFFEKKELVIKPNFIKDPGVMDRKRDDSYLFIGRLCEEKGISTLLKAFKGQNYNLKIIGIGPMQKEVETFAENNLNVKYLGFVNPAEVIEILSSCGALILSSGCMEMTSLTLIEGFACGTPIISSDVETLKVYISELHNGLLFKANEADSLTEQLSKFSLLPAAEKERLGKNARLTYEQNFTEEQSIQQLNAIYDKVLKRS